MYISRLAFHTVPGKTHAVEQHLLQMREMLVKAGGTRPRVSRRLLRRAGCRLRAGRAGSGGAGGPAPARHRECGVPSMDATDVRLAHPIPEARGLSARGVTTMGTPALPRSVEGTARAQMEVRLLPEQSP
jgi:hypothetical protein